MSSCVHTYTVYTSIGDEGYPEGEPAVHSYWCCLMPEETFLLKSIQLYIPL